MTRALVRLFLVRQWVKSRSVVSNSLQSCGLYSPWNVPGQNTGLGNCSLFQSVFPTQGSNPGLPHCRWILYQMSHQGNPGMLKWVAYPFSSGPSSPRNQTGVSCIAGGFFTSWATREAPGTPGRVSKVLLWQIIYNSISQNNKGPQTFAQKL